MISSEQFDDAARADGVFGESVTRWSHIEKTRSAKAVERVLNYSGPSDLADWFAGLGLGRDSIRYREDVPTPWRSDRDELLEISADRYRNIIGAAGLEESIGPIDPEKLSLPNLFDFHFLTLLIEKPTVLLDYGAGYGRQAFLWTSQLPGGTVIATDAVQRSYILQSWVFETLGLDVWEYIGWSAPTVQDVMAALEGPQDVVHLPSWRMDLVPAESVDVATFIWSLYEMSPEAARSAIEACVRVVRPGGYVYIRDAHHHVPYRADLESDLAARGFEEALHLPALAEDEFHGQIRLYRKTDKADQLPRFQSETGAFPSISQPGVARRSLSRLIPRRLKPLARKLLP